MFSKSSIKKIINYLKNKRIKSFNSYEDARKYCLNKTSNCYQSKYLTKYRFDKTEKFLKNGGNLANSQSAVTLLIALNIFQNKNPGKVPRVVDFGGACGESLILLKLIFKDELFKDSWIIELEAMVEESRNWQFSSGLNFNSNLGDILKNYDFDIFFSSGTIQYLKDPFLPLNLASKKSIPIIAMARNNFSSNPKVVAQTSKMFDNGINIKIDGYKNHKIFYPNSSVKKKKVINIFKKSRYDLIFDIPENSSSYGFDTYGSDLIFLKK